MTTSLLIGGASPRALRAIELFSCSGALAAGFREAGIEFELAFDLDEDACASYEANLGRRPIRMDARDMLRMGWNPGPIDLLVADPPCAPWSRAGKRKGLADERDMLEVTVEAITMLRPRAYLIGNIPGLEDGPNLPVVQRLIGGLARHGYCARDFAVLDAADYGVPQHRARPFWFGHLGGPCIQWPEPTHGDPRVVDHGEKDAQMAIPGVASLKPWVTCRAALDHLPLAELGRPVRMRKRNTKGKQHGSVLNRPARVVGTSNLCDGNVLMNEGEPSADPRGARGRTPQSERMGDLDRPAHAIDARPARAGQGDATVLAWPWNRPSTPLCSGDRLAPPGHHEKSFLSAPLMGERTGDPDAPARTMISGPSRVGGGAATTLDWPWERPATTLDTRDVLSPPGRDGRAQEDPGQRAHPNAIVLSERAAAILQGFPDAGWTFVGETKISRWKQIGMAVPIAVARALAHSIARALRGA